MNPTDSRTNIAWNRFLLWKGGAAVDVNRGWHDVALGGRMDRMKFLPEFGFCIGFGLAVWSQGLLAQGVEIQRSNAPRELGRDVSFRLELQRSVDKGLAWLKKNQEEGGYWSTEDHPAVTGLVLMSFMGDSSRGKGWMTEEFVQNGYRFLTDSIQPDGGIYRKPQLMNYNTSIGLMAMVLAGRDSDLERIRRARAYLVGQQQDYGDLGVSDTPLDGGIGYGNSYTHSDLSNTVLALEALFYSKTYLEEAERGGVGKDLNWAAAIHFVERCQNLKSHHQEPWASEDEANRGGFIYFPGDSKAGEMKLDDGKVALRSYGSMSYAGLLSFIYADMERGDPRIQAVQDWLGQNFTLEENPGMGAEGLYYYFHTMAKALSIGGGDWLKDEEGREVDWRLALGKRLLNAQNGEGYWVNENGRWWEKDACMVTAYSVMALERIMGTL